MNYKHYLDSCEHIGTFYNKHYLNQWIAEYNDFFNGGSLSSDFIQAMVDLKDDIYATISKEHWPYITERFLSCALNESGKYSHDAIVVFTVVSVEANCIGVNKSYSAQQKVKASHGGARKGSGRPKKEKTVQTRIPESLLVLILDLKDAYEDLNDFDKQTIRDSFQQVINEALVEGQTSNQVHDERHTNI